MLHYVCLHNVYTIQTGLKMGEPAHDKANKNNPVLSFRCSSPEMKERVKRKAEESGMSVQKYLLHAIQSHMDGGTPITVKRIAERVPKREDSEESLADLVKALEEVERYTDNR